MSGVGRVHAPSLPHRLPSLAAHGDALGDGVGVGGGRDPRLAGGHQRRRHAHVGRVRRAGGAHRRRPERGRPRAAAPRSRSTSTTATSTSRRSSARSRCAACRSTSTTAISTTSSGTCSTTPTPRRCSSTPRSPTGSHVSSTGCRSCRLLVEVDDTGAGDLLGGRAVAYDSLVAAHEPMPRDRPRRVRPVHALHRRHHGHAEGRDVRDRRHHRASSPASAFPWSAWHLPDDRRRDRAGGGRARRRGGTSVSVTGAPLMHGTGLWLGALMHHLGGGHVVTLTSRSLDADELLDGDPAPPLHAQHDRRRRLLEADHPRPRRRRRRAAEPYDTSSLQRDRLVRA